MLSCSWTFLRLEGFYFHDIHKTQGRSFSKVGYRIRKICDGKMYSRTRTFGAKYTNRILESQDSTKGYNKQITPLSIKQSLYYGSSIVSQLHFPLSKPHCHKLQEKIIIKLEIICYTVTQHKPSVRMDCTCIDFNDSYIFLTATYIFFIS